MTQGIGVLLWDFDGTLAHGGGMWHACLMETLDALEPGHATDPAAVRASNHVPELPEIVARLGLARYSEAVFTSAETGFETPHPEAFAKARATLGDPASIWMIEDNPVADVAGARAAGMPAVLVRGERVGAVDLDLLPDLLSA